MSESENELKSYIEQSLNDKFDKIITVKDTDKSKIYIFEHKETGKKIVQRISTNRNDDVFRTLRDIRNDNLVNVLDVCSDEEYLMVLEEYIEGKNLFEVIAKNNLSRKTAVKYVMQICNALTQLHKIGIIHRDIKPENIIINKDDNAVLIDFSIARRINSINESDTEYLGSIGYAAPEQFGLSQSSQATDIYSLGVLLNIMLTGEHPTVTVPKGAIKRVINKATSTQIAKRYSDAAQMKKALKRFL